MELDASIEQVNPVPDNVFKWISKKIPRFRILKKMRLSKAKTLSTAGIS